MTSSSKANAAQKLLLFGEFARHRHDKDEMFLVWGRLGIESEDRVNAGNVRGRLTAGRPEETRRFGR